MEVTAHILLRTGSGRTVESRTAVTSASLSALATGESDRQLVTAYFAGLGFEARTPSPLSVTISGASRLFEQTFGVELEVSEFAFAVRNSHGGTTRTLPTKNLPESIADRISAVTFAEPPEFGPSSY
jgi:hypothetical protein